MKLTWQRGLAAALFIGVVAAVLRPTPAQKREPDGRLTFTPHAATDSVRPGSSPLGLSASRDGFLFVPASNALTNRAPLMILLHGATQRSRLFERVTPAADSAGVVILAPDSRGMTWDAIRGDFGEDVEFLNRAITRAFDRAHIDPCRVVIGGFSDGASYALSLGIRNTRLLRGVVAFSPGFVIPATEIDTLPIFIRHGTNDQILPIASTSRPLIRALRAEGFEVDYAEFDGPHTMRPTDIRPAFEWASRRSCKR